MSYADSLLSGGERIYRREHQHWFVLVWTARYAVIGIILGVVLLVLRTFMSADLAQGIVGQLAGLLTAALVIGGLAVLLWSYLRYRSEEYVITNRRVIHAEGVINKKSTDSSLEKINDAVLMQSILGRIFGFGDLDILTASEEGVDRLRMLVDALDFKKAMLDAKHELELELTRPVSPPLRTGTPVREGDSNRASRTTADPDAPASAPAPAMMPSPPIVAPPPGPPVPPVPAGPAAMTADDVTRSLSQLADLRDRGAITPEEFDAKKAELLARL